MDNWWLAASPGQCTCLCITSHEEFFGETPNRPGDLALLQPRFGALQLLALPKIKITFEKEDISVHQWDSEKYDGVADGNWENFVRSQGAYFDGDWGIIVLCTVFLVPCIFFNKCLYFSQYMAGYSLDRPDVFIFIITIHKISIISHLDCCKSILLFYVGLFTKDL